MTFPDPYSSGLVSQTLSVTDPSAALVDEAAGSEDYSQVGNEDLEYALSEIRAHAPQYRKARLYARGLSPELFFMAPQAQEMISRMVEGFQLNFAAIPISVIYDRLSLNGFAGGPEAAVKRVIDDNKLWEWSGEAILDTLTDGDNYVVVRADDVRGAVLSTAAPTEARMFYDDETERMPWLFAREWNLRGVGRRANLWYPDRIERYVRPRSDGKWQLYETDELDSVEDNPLGEIPVSHLRTRFPYGDPIHLDAYGPQDMIVKEVMTFMAAVEFTGWPQRYLLQSVRQAGSGTLPGPASNGSPQARLRGGPGTIMELFGESVGQFAPADLDKLIKGIEFAMRSMAWITKTPLRHFQAGGTVPSGQSLLIEDAPVKAKAEAQRRSIGSGFANAFQLAVRVNTGEDAPLTTVWMPDPVISDNLWWATANIRRFMGISAEQIMTEAGYTPEQIEGFKALLPDGKFPDPHTLREIKQADDNTI